MMRDAGGGRREAGSGSVVPEVPDQCRPVHDGRFQVGEYELELVSALLENHEVHDSVSGGHDLVPEHLQRLRGDVSGPGLIVHHRCHWPLPAFGCPPRNCALPCAPRSFATWQVLPARLISPCSAQKKFLGKCFDEFISSSALVRSAAKTQKKGPRLGETIIPRRCSYFSRNTIMGAEARSVKSRENAFG